jgi:formate dehydrogenase subunit delta
MTVKNDKLVRMAEQVAANLHYDDDQEGLIARVTDHLNRFWDPRMKAAIRAHVDQGDAEISDTLRAAVARLPG